MQLRPSGRPYSVIVWADGQVDIASAVYGWQSVLRDMTHAQALEIATHLNKGDQTCVYTQDIARPTTIDDVRDVLRP